MKTCANNVHRAPIGQFPNAHTIKSSVGPFKRVHRPSMECTSAENAPNGNAYLHKSCHLVGIGRRFAFLLYRNGDGRKPHREERSHVCLKTSK